MVIGVGDVISLTKTVYGFLESSKKSKMDRVRMAGLLLEESGSAILACAKNLFSDQEVDHFLLGRAFVLIKNTNDFLKEELDNSEFKELAICGNYIKSVLEDKTNIKALKEEDAKKHKKNLTGVAGVCSAMGTNFRLMTS